MARRKYPEWTKERLRELETNFKKMTPAQLVGKHGRPYEVLVAVHEFALTSKRLMVSSTIVSETIAGKRMKFRLTRYAPGFAEGSHRMHD